MPVMRIFKLTINFTFRRFSTLSKFKEKRIILAVGNAVEGFVSSLMCNYSFACKGCGRRGGGWGEERGKLHTLSGSAGN